MQHVNHGIVKLWVLKLQHSYIKLLYTVVQKCGSLLKDNNQSEDILQFLISKSISRYT